MVTDDLITLKIPPRVSERRAADVPLPKAFISFFRLYNSNFLSPVMFYSCSKVFLTFLFPLTMGHVEYSGTKDITFSKDFMLNSITFVYFRPKKRPKLNPEQTCSEETMLALHFVGYSSTNCIILELRAGLCVRIANWANLGPPATL